MNMVPTFITSKTLLFLGSGFVAISFALAGCVSNPSSTADLQKLEGRVPAEKLLAVDCLLPPQIRKLGTQSVYATARRPIKTTALDCEIRGGEYVAYDRADYRTALQTWLPMAKQGSAEAQTYVGEIYEKGLGLKPDYHAAYIWYSKAADQGFSRAQINLGYLYEKGLGVESDPVAALNWYRKASGITDDIALSSDIDAKAQSIAAEATGKLQQEIARRDREIEQLKKSLNRARQQLKRRKAEMSSAVDTMNSLEREIQEQKHAGRETAELVRSYETQKTLVRKEQQVIARLQSQVTQQQQVLSKPTIQILEPPILATRGASPVLRVRSGASVQIIRGRIIAPAGIKLATLNGRTLRVDSQGMFNTALPIPSVETEVVVQAIDRQQRTERFLFRLVPEIVAEVEDEDIARVGRVASSIDFGRYYAVVIGNDEYTNFPQLGTAVNDARKVAELLKHNYGFDTRLITNADRYTVLSALNEVRHKLREQDNLLIYYAGHGEIDANTKQGYWLPVDAEKGNTANWVSNTSITDLLNTIKAKHILVVADSCYSGSMTRSSIPRLNTKMNEAHFQKWLQLMKKTRSRTVLTSGGLKPVLDSGGGKHSVFAKAFLKELEGGDGVIDAYRIFLDVSGDVQQAAASVGFKQVPTYAPIQHAGHGGGEFLLVSSG